jgi:hypothetical protein
LADSTEIGVIKGTIDGSLSVIEADSQIAVCDFGVSRGGIDQICIGHFDRCQLRNEFSLINSQASV